MHISLWKLPWAIGALCLIAYWYVSFSQHHSKAEEWEAIVGLSAESRADVLASAALVDVPARTRHLLDYGYFWGEQSFPPDFAKAESALHRAILLNPLDSRVWLVLARHLYFKRNNVASKLALARSDALSPVYTQERIASLEIRELLGDREGVLEVARKIAATHPANAAKTTEYLRTLGLPSGDIFRAVSSPGQSAEEVARVLTNLAPATEADLAGILEMLPPAIAREPVVVRTALRQAITIGAESMIPELWALHAGSRLEPIAGTAGLMMVDPGMLKDPAQNAAPLGWIPPPSSSEKYTVQWSSGRIRMEFRPSFDEDDRTIRHRLVRLPVPAGPAPTVWQFSVSSNQPLRSRVQLVANDGSKSYQSPLVSLDEAGKRAVGVVVPAASQFRVVEVRLERLRDGAGSQAGVHLDVSSLQIDFAEEVPAP